MDISKIIKVDISIAESALVDGGFNYMLLFGPLPANAAGKITPDVASYSSTQELKEVGFSTIDPVYNAAEKAFSQSPKPAKIYVAVQKLISGVAEAVDVTLDRAKAVTGWYAVCPVGIEEDRYQDIANWVEANNKICICQTTGISTHPVADTMNRTAVIHASSESDYINAALLGRFLSYDPGSVAWSYKSLSTISAQSLSAQEINTLEQNNTSYYVSISGKNVVMGGKMCSGEWIDTIHFCDWLVAKIQEKVYNLMLKYPKIPYTDAGIAMVQNAVMEALDAGVKSNGIAEPQQDGEDEVPSYTIVVPRASDIDEAVRKTRKLEGVKFTARLAGAILFTDISGTVSY